MLRRKRGGQKCMSSACPFWSAFSAITNFYSWNGLATRWVWPTGGTSQISEDGRELRFGYSSGSLLHGLLVGNDSFSSEGHTSCLEALTATTGAVQYPASLLPSLWHPDPGWQRVSLCLVSGASLFLLVLFNPAHTLENSSFIKFSSITSFHSVICFLSRLCLI